jgi:hypothetical protein
MALVQASGKFRSGIKAPIYRGVPPNFCDSRVHHLCWWEPGCHMKRQHNDEIYQRRQRYMMRQRQIFKRGYDL